MINLQNDFILAAIAGILTITLVFIYNKLTKNEKCDTRNNYIGVFIYSAALVYGALYLKNNKIELKGGSPTESVYSNNVNINEPNF